jgi:non-reducing end alpha-L-arabinofuranosidase
MCVDDSGGKGLNGDSIIIYSCSGNNNQKWTFSNGEFVGKASNRCLNVSGGVAVKGAHVILWDCVGTTNEKWTF